ncbi:UNVERIFIED_CONTAM: Retrovirus-related Pol polyprotein from transposon TNT 1-94 [Sesamum indicum]
MLRRSESQRRSTISDDYVIYSLEHECDLSIDKDHVTFQQAIECSNSEKWIDAMKEELKSMSDNNVWDLVELSEGYKRVGCKWVFKTKQDSKGNIETYKTRLVAKGYTKKDGIDYKETFSLVSKKDSLRIILALVAHYDLELHQMDVKIAFLNGNLEEEVSMEQPEGFLATGKETMVCKLRKSIYGLQQASRQWYLKFNNTITSYRFIENIVDRCIYMKFSGSRIVILVVYVDDILLAANDTSMLHDVKKFLSKNFEMEDMCEASYVIRIEIFRDRLQGLLGLSQKCYIYKVLERFKMDKCSAGIVPIQKGDKFNQMQCPKNDLERKEMESIPYASVVGSLMYVQTCTRPDISFVIGMLGRYQSNPGMDHWKAAKKVFWHLQGTKDHMLMYKRSYYLEVIGYLDSDYTGCIDTRKSKSGYVFLLAEGVVLWKSGKQSVIATSTMEAEFVACFEATVHGLWLRNFISRLGIVNSIAKPLRIYCDNFAAVFFSKNDKYSKSAKHMELKYLLVKEEVQKHRVSIEHINMDLIVADPLTKGLPPKIFSGHVERMGIIAKSLLA